jgi:hypothetical protein
MSKRKLLFGAGWCVAGLLALAMALRVQPAGAKAGVAASTVVEAIRTRCELPANTVVFVVRPEETDQGGAR